MTFVLSDLASAATPST